MSKAKRILPPTYFFASIILMLILHFLAPVAKFIGYPWDLLGIVPLALGIILNLIADAAFKKHGTTVKPFEESSTLVTAGVFRFSRNPMYFGMVLILIGIAVLMGSLTPFLVVVTFGILMDMAFIRTEERMLEEKFGGVWLTYKKQVRRWI